MTDESSGERKDPLEKKLNSPIPKNMAGIVKNEYTNAHVPELVD